MLSLLLFLPAIGALVIAFMPRARERDARLVALGFTLVVFLLSIVVFVAFDSSQEGYQFVDRFEWIRAAEAGFSIQYAVGVDGLSAPLLLLLGLLTVVAVLVSWNIDVKPRQYFAWLLLLETAVAGSSSRWTSCSSSSSGSSSCCRCTC
jgi:NADH-quinone oxidoreductase subunit M